MIRVHVNISNPMSYLMIMAKALKQFTDLEVKLNLVDELVCVNYLIDTRVCDLVFIGKTNNKTVKQANVCFKQPLAYFKNCEYIYLNENSKDYDFDNIYDPLDTRINEFFNLIGFTYKKGEPTLFITYKNLDVVELRKFIISLNQTILTLNTLTDLEKQEILTGELLCDDEVYRAFITTHFDLINL